jgi:hypothetical protein
MLVCVPLPAAAQDAFPHKNVISANPFLLIAEWFNGEFERKVSTESSLGVRASTIKIDDARYVNARAFYRYYPSGALQKFYLGVDAGVTTVDDVNDESHSVGGAGFELGYNWLLGARRKLYLSLGVGADRLFGSGLEDLTVVIPTVRVLNVGFAF